MLTGADIRRYRKLIDMPQVEFAEIMDFTQAAISLIEKGVTAVSDDHVRLLRERFTAPKYQPAFTKFEKEIQRERSRTIGGGKTGRGEHLTLTVWRWEDGLDLSQEFLPSQAVDLVTIRAVNVPVVAFAMGTAGKHWQEGEIIVFRQCSPTDLENDQLCLVHFRTPRAKAARSLLAVTTVRSGKSTRRIELHPVSPILPRIDVTGDMELSALRPVYRARYIDTE